MTIMDYTAALNDIQADVWQKLDENQKLEVLQALERNVAEQQGRFPCVVEAKWLHTGPDSIELGYYDPSSQHICINVSQFDPESKYGVNSEKIVETLFHEGRHAYQHQVVEGLINTPNEDQAQEWAHNLADGNYIRFEENPRAYWSQPVEADARAFAKHQLARTYAEQQAHINKKSVCEAIDVFNSHNAKEYSQVACVEQGQSVSQSLLP